MAWSGPPPGAFYASMTGQQEEALIKIKQAHQDHQEARHTATIREAALHDAIFDALERQVPPRVVAACLGTTAARVFQMRDAAGRRK